MPSKAEIEKRVATFGDPKSNGKWREFVEAEKKDVHLKKLIKHGVEESSVPVSKAPQGSKQHKEDIASHVNILHNNINNRYPTQASPEQFGKLAERIERSRQMTGGPSTWDIYKKAADTPQEKKEIREIIREDYKKNGPKNMDPDDLKLIGKGKITPNIKIDVSGISSSINNYINATRANAPVPPPKKQRDPDLDLGLASLIGGSNEF
jgi:hypothetical protein